LTQLELAKRISQIGPYRYGDSFLSKLEHGRSRTGINFWMQVADFLGLKISALFVLIEMLAGADDKAEERKALVRIVLATRAGGK